MFLPRNLILYLFIIYCAIIGTSAHRILAVFPFNARSHNNIFEGVTKALAKRGHQMDVISHFELASPLKNYKTIINLSGTVEPLLNNWSMKNVSMYEHLNSVVAFSSLLGNNLCELLALDEIQGLLKNPPQDPPYDLVITEASFENCYIGFGNILKVPVITISCFLESLFNDEAIGNPTSLAFGMNIDSDKTKLSTFWDRLENTFFNRLNQYEIYKSTGDFQTELMRKYLSPDIPNVRDVERNVALMLANTHHTIYGVRPLTPALIPISGIHIEQYDAKITPELKAWLDESKHGVVLFTLGSIVLIETLPEETLLAFYASFAKIAPIRVLIKIANKEKLPAGLPENVLTMPWVPQHLVLGHNNTRIFITHSGLMSVQEALYNGIPMIGFPLFFDQFLNANIFTSKNMSLRMNYKKITEKSLDEALNTVLYDPKYREAAERESRLFRDRPMSATDTVIFWVEYIIRNGADPLRSPAVDLYWWQVELLDVYGFLIMCTFIISYATFLIFKNAIQIMINILRSNFHSHKKED